ncbi:MAG: HAMP domain-containing histidine kinase [Clostridia bacterium]|nr:HAMP domain-containing histidine kinase [Clostridia bacterium]
MTDYKKKRFRLFPNVRVQVFVQFVMLFLIILSLILFSSSTFYTSMIESVMMFEMRDAANKMNSVDLSSPQAINSIMEIEVDHNILIEIYSMDDSGEYGDSVYLKCNYSVLSNYVDNDNLAEQFTTILNFKHSDFELLQEYDDSSFVGTSYNLVSNSPYFVFGTPSDNGKYLFIAAVEYANIEIWAKSIAISAAIITLVIFISVSIATYFYITRITKPLNDIIQVTKIMAEEKNKSIRIPSRHSVIKTDTDDAIFRINTLYESLMLTQERLLEKSEFLAEQLEEKEIEQKSRARFIADTSHELKTPISIIQGYAEGIKYVLDDKNSVEEYCDTILEECTRMTGLVVNMMSLSNIQHSDNLTLSDFCINDFIDERLRLHQKVFEKNNIQAFCLIKDRIFGFADTAKMQFVINNLLSNATSYIGGDQKRIEVNCEELEMCYRIYVYNTGEHISPDTLQKLWDSFYRQDAARLRSEGHFGLGLSIVKAVQDAHSQQCGVENTEGGVQFWFDIAKGTDNQNNNA